MKKLIFSLLILLAAASIASAQVTLDGDYSGTVTDPYMGQQLTGIYNVTTTFSNNTMTGITMTITPPHTISFNTNPAFTDNGDDTYTWNNSPCTGVVTVMGQTRPFTVTSITNVELVSGKLTYYFEAYVTGFGIIYFTFVES